MMFFKRGYAVKAKFTLRDNHGPRDGNKVTAVYTVKARDRKDAQRIVEQQIREVFDVYSVTYLNAAGVYKAPLCVNFEED